MEYCIMPDNPPYWRNYEAIKTRREKYHRHEIFFGWANRKLSIEDGLVVFLRPEQHNMGNHCVHRDPDYDLMLKKAGQTQYELTHTRAEFMARYGRNYL